MGPYPPTLENMVILYFERRFSKQNSVIRLKSNILDPTIFFPKKIFGLATPLPWSTSATLSCECRQQDLLRQSFLGNSLSDGQPNVAYLKSLYSSEESFPSF